MNQLPLAERQQRPRRCQTKMFSLYKIKGICSLRKNVFFNAASSPNNLPVKRQLARKPDPFVWPT